MAEGSDGASGISPAAFSKLLGYDRKQRAKERVWEAEWASRDHEAGGLIAQLRARAKSAQTWAMTMLAGLVLIGLAGAAWFVVDILGFEINDADEALREAQRAQIDARIALSREELGPLATGFNETRLNIVAALQEDFVSWPVQGVTADLNHVAFSDVGDVVVVGNKGLVLTMSRQEGFWRNVSKSSLTADLFGVAASQKGNFLAVGDVGTIVEGTVGDPETIDVSANAGGDLLLGVAIGSDGEAIATGRGGRVFTRASGDSVWVQSEVIRPANLWRVAIGEDGAAVAVGDGGAVLTRAAGGTEWMDASERLLPESVLSLKQQPNLYGLALGSDGEVIASGTFGVAMQSPGLNMRWRQLNVSDSAMLGAAKAENGLGVIVGDNGLVAIRDTAADEWEKVEIAASQPFFRDVAIGAGGEIVIVGRQGAIYSRGLGALAIQAAQDEGRVLLLLEGLGQHPQMNDWTAALRSLQSRRAELEARIAALDADKQAAERGLLTQKQKLDEMTAFLGGCLAEGHARDAEAIAACRDAYVSATTDSSFEFYKYLTTRITPAALVLFLLATLGGAYRYNIRLATHLHARADALEAGTLHLDGARMIALAEAFGADSLQFKEARLPIDAVTDVAKQTIAKLGPKA